MLKIHNNATCAGLFGSYRSDSRKKIILCLKFKFLFLFFKFIFFEWPVFILGKSILGKQSTIFGLRLHLKTRDDCPRETEAR